MKKAVLLFVAILFIFGTGTLIAQEVTPAVEIDLPAHIEIAMAIFLTGIGGMSVTAITTLLKRIINAQGLFVIAISVIVSAGAVLLYLIPFGFVLWKFVVLTVIVALAANGIYLTPEKRTEIR